MSKKYLYLLLLTTVIFWGTSFIIVQDTIQIIPPIHFLYLRLIAANLVFFSILYIKKVPTSKILYTDYPRIFFLGFIGVSGYFLVQYNALTYTSSVNAALIIGTSPILIALYKHFVAKDTLSFIQNLGISLSFIGLVCVITEGDLSSLTHAKTIWGDLLMLINVVMLATFTLSASTLLKKYDPFTLIAYIHLAAIIILTPFVLTSNYLSQQDFFYYLSNLSLSILLRACYLGIACTVFGYYVWYLSIKQIGPTKTAVFSYLNPLIATITARIVLDQTLSSITLWGGFYIILGLIMCNRQSNQLDKSFSN